ncbi:MAG: ABC transporter ATP-binding protein [Desulfovibrio sp.]|nr:ABC transporter ATP-binding protein [Desulfovibrio sp.]
MTMTPICQFANVSKTFRGAEENLEIFKDINFLVNKGESLAILGASGSGKSTLLHLMGALDKPTTGKILFEGRDLAEMTPLDQASFRNKSLGFVFQFHHLLPEFTALENVAMPGLIAGLPRKDILPRARDLLEKVGLKDRMESRPATLSGGERQRAAIARALLLNPALVLADEPTGNLDEQTGRQVGDLLLTLNRKLGMTLVIVTHNRDLAAKMDRSLDLRDGVLYEKSLS